MNNSISFEQLALQAIKESGKLGLSWVDFTSKLKNKEDEFNKKIEKFEKSDIQAQNIASSFYVR